MLTKDLIQFRRSGENIKPKFIEVDDPKLLSLAEQLLAFYDSEQRPLRSEIDENVGPIIKTFRDLKLAKGLDKLLKDRSEFSSPTEHDYPAMRERIFKKSASLTANAADYSMEEYQQAVMAACDQEERAFVENGLYADLPENEYLVKFRRVSPKELLQRYNCSLVQSLLLYSDGLDVKIADPDSAKMRKIFKYLRFFRLLAKVTADKMKKNKGKTGEVAISGGIRMHIDGPVSLFENTQKYGLQLASFFPALCELEKWKIVAGIKLNDRQLRLSLNQDSGLVSHYRNFSAYVPEEISMFHKLFKKKVDHWDVVGHTPFFDLGNQELLFPDLSFERQDGTLVHLELFHRWHATQLLQRLEQCETQQDLPLIVGVDRFLYNKLEIKRRVDDSEWFEKRGFLFRDFPGVDRVRKLLDESSA